MSMQRHTFFNATAKRQKSLHFRQTDSCSAILQYFFLRSILIFQNSLSIERDSRKETNMQLQRDTSRIEVQSSFSSRGVRNRVQFAILQRRKYYEAANRLMKFEVLIDLKFTRHANE